MGMWWILWECGGYNGNAMSIMGISQLHKWECGVYHGNNVAEWEYDVYHGNIVATWECDVYHVNVVAKAIRHLKS